MINDFGLGARYAYCSDIHLYNGLTGLCIGVAYVHTLSMYIISGLKEKICLQQQLRGL